LPGVSVSSDQRLPLSSRRFPSATRYTHRYKLALPDALRILNGLDRSWAVVSVTSPTDPIGLSGGLFSAVVNTNASVHISAPEGNRRTAFATYSVFATRPVATTPTRAAVDQPLSKAGASDVPLRGQTSHRASTWPWSGTLNWAVVRPV